MNFIKNSQNDRNWKDFPKNILNILWCKFILRKVYKISIAFVIDRNQYKTGEKSYPVRHWNGMEKENEREREREMFNFEPPRDIAP